MKAREFRYNSKGERMLMSGEQRKGFEIPKCCSDKSALVLSRYYYKDGDLDYTEIAVYSPYIMTALRKINLDPRRKHGVNLDSNPIVFRRFERYIFHIHQELRQHAKTLTDPRAATHIDLTLQYLDRMLHREMRTYHRHVEGPFLIPGLHYEHLWMAFRPGEEIYCKQRSREFVGRFVTMSTFSMFAKSSVDVDTIVYDGTSFGFKQISVEIPPYKGYMPFENLDVLPLKYHPRRHAIKDSMIQRGRKFVSLHGMHHCEYKGAAQVLEPFRKRTRDDDDDDDDDDYPLRDMMIDSRIIIDGEQFIQERPSHQTGYSHEIKTQDDGPLSLDDDDLLICKAVVMGFSLADKLWGFFYVEFIEDVTFNERAFQDLRLPSEQKQMISSLITVHENSKIGFDDFIKGKGKGMIMLLHGAPGTGKTLTAESVAEFAKKPLYSMSVGSLGTKAGRMERYLVQALRRATIWNSVLLIDEADVFLEQRSVHDLERNALVLVFLRVLEYHEGIVLLTTNRVGSFDLAFKSRIHLAINYTTLTPSTRRELWQMFLERAFEETKFEADWVEHELDRLASFDINGREIKNAVTVARGMAMSQGTGIRIEHIDLVLKCLQKFEVDFAMGRRELLSEVDDVVGSEGLTGDDRPTKKRRRE